MSAEKPPTPPAAKGGTAPAAGTTTKCPFEECVVKITAKIKGTKGKRDATKVRPEKVLTPSSSADESLASNAPVILVRGCLEVELAAETTPPDKPVTWQVKPNENTGTAPGITPTDGGKKATLKTGETGSFSVIATLGKCKVVWNVVFVWVKVDPASTTAVARSNKYAASGVGGVKSGSFSAGNYAWEATVKAELIGGGADGKMGIDKVKLHTLQSGVVDDLQGVYDGGGTGSETVPTGLPVVDSTARSTDSPFSPFVTNLTAATVKPNNTDKNREVWTGDSPAGGFQAVHAGKKLQSIKGTNGFRTAVASTSDDAPDAIVVHAGISWTADYSGTVNASGVYAPSGARTTTDAAYALIASGTGGQDACDAGFETFPPIFRDVTIIYSF